jgi:hypothetical protein
LQYRLLLVADAHADLHQLAVNTQNKQLKNMAHYVAYTWELNALDDADLVVVVDTTLCLDKAI